MRIFHLLITCVLTLPCLAEWRILPPTEQRTSRPQSVPADAKVIEPGGKWEDADRHRWMIGALSVPSSIDGKPTAGRCVGLRLNAGDGGEVHVEGVLQCRYDNDHPALVVVAEKAVPGTKVRVDVLLYAKVQGGDTFGEAAWVIIDEPRATGALQLTVDAGRPGDAVPRGLAGLSQGGGLSDYEDATAAKLKEGGFRWFRMDNVFTGVLKKDAAGKFIYDWSEFDRRVDFIAGKMGADPIMAVSYMPQVLDAVENHDRQSAPADYKVWEELCFQAAKRCLERKVRVPFWEVWNEVNTGWLKPGPQDTGSDEFKRLYTKALGREQGEHEVVRRFEAYCKLYAATARGVLRADPKAKIGGPALASGPMEHEDCGHCFHGKGFARGLMLWCEQQKLPLDFVSWHEYFQDSRTIARQGDTFREYLKEFPSLEKSVRSLMVTEWNQAWWADRPHDHEVGAAWCADGLVRAMIPHRIDRPCFFYVKQNDTNFRGDFSLLMQDNVPKASYNALKLFNGLSGRWLALEGGDDDVAGVAAWDAEKRRLAVVLVNFRDRYGVRRHVRLSTSALPEPLRTGVWREWVVDATHANVWHDAKAAELAVVREGRVDGAQHRFERTLMPNSITLIELLPAGAARR